MTTGRNITEEVTGRPLIAEAWVQSQTSPCETSGGKGNNGIVFLRVFRVFPTSIVQPMLPTHLSTYNRYFVSATASIVKQDV